jgi:hypothetical protein
MDLENRPRVGRPRDPDALRHQPSVSLALSATQYKFVRSVATQHNLSVPAIVRQMINYAMRFAKPEDFGPAKPPEPSP